MNNLAHLQYCHILVLSVFIIQPLGAYYNTQAPASAPAPEQTRIEEFMHRLVSYGGYNEFADVLVNLTSLAMEMGRLVSEGYSLTVLAPNDGAMAMVTEAGAAERMVYYHLIPEYLTEESVHNAVRRLGRVRYETLSVPYGVVAREADGAVRFDGAGEKVAYLYDPDIYTDGSISVQGIDQVLIPEETGSKVQVQGVGTGKLVEIACRILGSLRQRSWFSACSQYK